MKVILALVEEYLRKYPSPTSIISYKNILKLNYTYSTPFSDSKNTSQILYPIENINAKTPILPQVAKLVYNEKGRIEQVNSFDSILTKENHQKLFQDDVFGQAQLSKNKNRWIYIAEGKPQTLKSLFNAGKGKRPYKYDFGETYDDVKQVNIYIWDKQLKKIFKIQTDQNLIPSFPSFADDQGNSIIFHAYKKQNFGHGILHCFNRQVSLYSANLELKITQKQKKQGEQKKQGAQEKVYKLQAKIGKLLQDSNKTNIFPSISPCYNYIIYLSGTGLTHTFYLDLVILRRQKEGDTTIWKETHRIKDKFIGYYNVLKTFIANQGGRPTGFVQTLHQGKQEIHEIDLQNGEIKDIIPDQQPGESYSILEVLPSGDILGKKCTHNYNTFFYRLGKQINVIPPLSQENFNLVQIKEPVHAFYLESKEEHILTEYKERAAKRPIVLMAHGGPHGSVDPSLTLFKYVLLKLGYGLLFPNFSGSVGYGAKFVENSLKNIGETDAKEMIALLDNLFKQNQKIDQKQVHVHGGSYGGYTAAIMGSRYSSYFKSAVILNGVLSISANLWFTDIPEWNTVQALNSDKLSGLSAEHYAEMHRQSPISEPMKIPTLQFLGAKDRRVPYRQGLLFDAITKDIGTPITTYVYENSNHSLADSTETSMDIIVKSVMFLEGISLQEKKEENKQ